MRATDFQPFGPIAGLKPGDTVYLDELDPPVAFQPMGPARPCSPKCRKCNPSIGAKLGRAKAALASEAAK